MKTGVLLFCTSIPVYLDSDCPAKYMYRIANNSTRLRIVDPTKDIVSKVIRVKNYLVQMPNHVEVNL